MGVCMCVCVCHHHSPVDSFLCVYVCICMLTPLNDCNYIRQYFTVNYKVLDIKKRPEICVCVCTHVRSTVGMGVCVYYHHSPIDNVL